MKTKITIILGDKENKKFKKFFKSFEKNIKWEIEKDKPSINNLDYDKMLYWKKIVCNRKGKEIPSKSIVYVCLTKCKFKDDLENYDDAVKKTNFIRNFFENKYENIGCRVFLNFQDIKPQNLGWLSKKYHSQIDVSFYNFGESILLNKVFFDSNYSVYGNNIAHEVTYERLKTVITGKRKNGSKYSDGFSASLKYYKVDFVEITDKLYYEYADELLEHVKELVELENAIDFDKDNTIAICLTEEEIDKFTESLDAKTELKKIYLGHDIQLTDKQDTLFENLGVEVIQIPEYYYDED